MEKAYEQIDRAKWEKIKGAAAAAGFKIEENTGRATAMGATIRWAYFPASQQLSIVIVDGGYVSKSQALDYVEAIILQA